MNKLFIFLILLFMAIPSFADIIYLKDGSSIKGEIVKETDEFITVKETYEFGSMASDYKKSDIERIEITSEEEKRELELAKNEAEKLVGEWNDDLGAHWKLNIKIMEHNKKFYQINTFQDGSSSKADLIEIKPKKGQKRAFKDLSSSHGEFYVVDENGNLDMYDREGFIREAKRVQGKEGDIEQIKKVEKKRYTPLSQERKSAYKAGYDYGYYGQRTMAGLDVLPKHNKPLPEKYRGPEYKADVKKGISDGIIAARKELGIPFRIA